MRKIAQLVALMSALLFAGQSTLAETQCSQWLHSGDPQIPNCCITAPGTPGLQLAGACHGSMQPEPVASKCNQSGCNMETVRTAAQAITASKFGSDRAVSLAAMTQLPVIPASALPNWPFESASAPGPARYLLCRAFRI